MVVKEYGELTLAPLPSKYNRSTGQFFKGYTPHNKGKKWETYLNKKQQKKRILAEYHVSISSQYS